MRLSAWWAGTAQLSRRTAVWSALSTGWLAMVAAGGTAVYRRWFVFDPLDGAAWTALSQSFSAGAVIPFDFVAIGAALVGAGIFGCLLLAVRPPRVHLAFGRPFGTLARLCGGVLWRWPGRWLGRWLRRVAAAGWRARRAARVHRRTVEPSLAPPAAAATPAPPERREPSFAPAEPVAPPDAEASEDDRAALGRALSVVEVWTDPPAEWMKEALAEDLDRLSAAGWGLLADFGGAARRLLELAAAHRLLPADPARRGAVDGLLAGLAVPEDASPAGDAPPSEAAPASLTLCAAWLCELVDNYQTLEELRLTAAAEFDAHWRVVHDETAENLRLAMRSMSDRDWASLDRYPDRASRIRVLTDRLCEEFRAARGTERPPAVAPCPAGPPAVAAAPPGPAEPLDLRLGELLADRQFAAVPAPLAVGPLPGRARDFLARRGDVALLLRLLPLGGGRWSAEGGGAWRNAEGSVLPSPCRGLWQRLTLLRSLGEPAGLLAGAVVVAGGTFDDEAGLAAAAQRERVRTGVAVVRLDGPSSGLPELTAWLAEVAPAIPATDPLHHGGHRDHGEE